MKVLHFIHLWETPRQYPFSGAENHLLTLLVGPAVIGFVLYCWLISVVPVMLQLTWAVLPGGYQRASTVCGPMAMLEGSVNSLMPALAIVSMLLAPANCQSLPVSL